MKRLFSLLALASCALSGPVFAQEAAMSAWDKGPHASMRLIAGATAPSGKQRVGVDIQMQPGYKTYWRSPGDFGVPPVFDWSESNNVSGVDVRWPTPERFEEAAGFSVGYVGEIVLPVSVRPVDPALPVMVVLRLDYAVCEKICIPVKSEARLWLEPGVTAVSSPRLEQSETRVPLPTKPGMHRDRLSVVEAAWSEGTSAQTLRLVLSVPDAGRIDDIFVEGPGMWSFGKPRLQPQADGTVVAMVGVHDRPKGAAGPTPFIVTVRGQPAAIETRLDIEVPAAKP